MPSPAVVSLLLALAGYLVGSLSFAVIVSRSMGLDDPRSYGSGNPGATNVLRSGNRTAAILTLLFDALKGVVPVLLARWLHARGLATDWAAPLAGLAAFLGHLWPVFFRFQGGKGVATAAGVMLALDPVVGLVALAVWLAIAFTTRYSSLASLLAALAAPFAWLLLRDDGTALVALVPMAALLVWRHASNIRKLLAGTESRIGSRAGKPGATEARAGTAGTPGGGSKHPAKGAADR